MPEVAKDNLEVAGAYAIAEVAPGVDNAVDAAVPGDLRAEVAGDALGALPASNDTDTELSPEDVTRILATLEARFMKMKADVFPNLEWSKVKMALEANPKGLRAIDRMEQEGHQPAIYNVLKFGFDVGTYSLKVPESTRGCANDERAANWLRQNHPEIKFNGSAAQNAAAMGLEVVEQGQYFILQDQQPFDLNDKIHLFTDPMSETRNLGKANVGFRNEDYEDRGPVHISTGKASDLHGWRGTVRIPWAN